MSKRETSSFTPPGHRGRSSTASNCTDVLLLHVTRYTDSLTTSFRPRYRFYQLDTLSFAILTPKSFRFHHPGGDFFQLLFRLVLDPFDFGLDKFVLTSFLRRDEIWTQMP